MGIPQLAHAYPRAYQYLQSTRRQWKLVDCRRHTAICVEGQIVAMLSRGTAHRSPHADLNAVREIKVKLRARGLL